MDKASSVVFAGLILLQRLKARFCPHQPSFFNQVRGESLGPYLRMEVARPQSWARFSVLSAVFDIIFRRVMPSGITSKVNAVD